MATQYRICRVNKTTKAHRFLSRGKKRWLPNSAKHKYAMAMEAEFNEFITTSKGLDTETYYYFKTLTANSYENK